MTSITIPDVPDSMKDGLESYAIENGLTLEAYLRMALEKLPGAQSLDGASIVELANQYFGPHGHIDLDLSGRDYSRPPVVFDE